MDYLKNQDLEITSLDDIRKLETTPFSELSLPASTYRLFQDAAGRWPDQVALRFLPTAELEPNWGRRSPRRPMPFTPSA